MLTLAVTYAGLLGGAERTLVDFARAIPGGTALACPEGPLAEHARDAGLAVLPIPERGLELRGGRGLAASRDLAAHGRDLRRLVRALRPELVLAWGMRSAIAAPPALVGLQPRPALLIRHVDFLPGPLIARLVRRACRRAERVSVNSQAVARDLDSGGRLGRRLSVISPGVELSRYETRWDVAREPLVLLAGALEPWKRPDLALEAVALAARELPRIRLSIVGAPVGA